MRIFVPLALGLLLLASRPSEASPLLDAAKKGDATAIAAALDGGADINDTSEKTTALFDAVANGHLEAAQLLLQKGADPNLPGKFRKTPLQSAVTKQNVEMAKLLLAGGADPDAAVSGLAPLHSAADNGCLDCVVALLDAAADVNLLSSEGSPPIHFAKLNGHEDIAEYLRAHGAETFALPSIVARLASAQPSAGEAIFVEICGACHRSLKTVMDGAAPPLWNVVGRKRGSVEGFEYSPAMKNDGGTWTYDSLNNFIFSPARTVPGMQMSFDGIQDEAQRADIIAYLRTLSDAPQPLP